MEEKKGAPPKPVVEVTMPDVSQPVFVQMLKFIYTDQVEITSPNEAIDLWTISDRYRLDALKFQAESYLHVNLTVSKAIEIGQTESLQLFEQLKELLVSFLADHFEEAMDLPGFVQIPAALLHSILRQVKAIKQQNKILQNAA